MTYAEIPWPADLDTLPRDEWDQIQVGVFYVYALPSGEWAYAHRDENACLGLFESAYDAVNEGALRDNYREEP